jgi:hypothetical protein
MPNQNEQRYQAIDGISACPQRRTTRRWLIPTSGDGAAVQPRRTVPEHGDACASVLLRSLVPASSRKVLKITDGGGTSRPFDSPMRTANPQSSASATAA